jgi:hypothetical protein
MTEPEHHINESAHPFTHKFKVVRGTGTRDQDKHDMKVKAESAEQLAERSEKVIAEMQARNVYESVRVIQPGETDD